MASVLFSFFQKPLCSALSSNCFVSNWNLWGMPECNFFVGIISLLCNLQQQGTEGRCLVHVDDYKFLSFTA